MEANAPETVHLHSVGLSSICQVSVWLLGVSLELVSLYLLIQATAGVSLVSVSNGYLWALSAASLTLVSFSLVCPGLGMVGLLVSLILSISSMSLIRWFA